MKSSLFSPREGRDALRVLNAVAGLGNRSALKLIQHCGSPQKVFESVADGSLRRLGAAEQILGNIEAFDGEGFLKTEERMLREHGARVVTILDEGYPAHLKEIPDAPIVLYLQGKLPGRIENSVAIVGARDATLYGLQMAERFARELAEAGVPVVSGLARGIDAAAHRGALRSSGETVGVLGCGLDIVYPKENRALFGNIREKGCIISEFPFGTPPLAWNFPRRNRIVSGLSCGVLVVEANVKSGALITVEFALEQGRDVFAIPGRVDSPMSQGPHAIIRQGARLVVSADDILQELPEGCVRSPAVQGPACPADTGLKADEKDLLNIIREGSVSLDFLGVKTGKNPSGLMAPLLSLQLKKIIRELPGKIYELVKGS